MCATLRKSRGAPIRFFPSLTLPAAVLLIEAPRAVGILDTVKKEALSCWCAGVPVGLPVRGGELDGLVAGGCHQVAGVETDSRAW